MIQPEIEAKFCAVDLAEMRQRLQAAGATCTKPMRLMRRVMYTVRPDYHPDAFVRIRDEGSRTTITYKQFDNLSLHGVGEIEVQVSDFEKAQAIFAAVGAELKSFQESRRESWQLGNAEVLLDEWPWLQPYLEIEADSELAVRRAASALQLDFSQAVFGDVMAAYRQQYPHLTLKQTVGQLPQVRFGNEVPEMLKI